MPTSDPENWNVAVSLVDGFVGVLIEGGLRPAAVSDGDGHRRGRHRRREPVEVDQQELAPIDDTRRRRLRVQRERRRRSDDAVDAEVTVVGDEERRAAVERRDALDLVVREEVTGGIQVQQVALTSKYSCFATGVIPAAASVAADVTVSCGVEPLRNRFSIVLPPTSRPPWLAS